MELGQFIQNIKALNIPRAEDLPYWTSPPIQFVYESTATPVLGTYTWSDAPTALTTRRPILDNVLYYFRNITLTADIEELDFTLNIPAPSGSIPIPAPQFFMFKQSDSNAVMFREPIIMNTFYTQFDYRFFWMTHLGDDVLRAAFRGYIAQGPSLVGKGSITLKAIISAQEIVDEGFIKLFLKKYPDSAESIGSNYYAQ